MRVGHHLSSAMNLSNISIHDDECDSHYAFSEHHNINCENQIILDMKCNTFFCKQKENNIKYDDIIYKKTDELQKMFFNDTFKSSKINGKIVHLARHKSDTCIICSRAHQHENAYIYIDFVSDSYIINFGCYRCINSKKKMIPLGIITNTNYIIYPDCKSQQDYNTIKKNINYTLRNRSLTPIVVS